MGGRILYLCWSIFLCKLFQNRPVKFEDFSICEGKRSKLGLIQTLLERTQASLRFGGGIFNKFKHLMAKHSARCEIMFF